MDLKRLNAFLAAADELHFGRAAQKLDILPSALGRNIRLLEEELGVRLFNRTTRNVVLTRSGHLLQKQAPDLLSHANELVEAVRHSASGAERVFRIGAIDSASMGLLPELVHDVKTSLPELELFLVEDKTANLLPKLLSGALDVAFVRPPEIAKAGIEFDFLLHESTIVALPESHPLATNEQIQVQDLEGVPLIVPSPRSRPHSYNLTIRLFNNAGLQPTIVQQAEEKQTIINLVGASIGAAIIPYWYNSIKLEGVVYRPMVDEDRNPIRELPLAAAWVTGTPDESRDRLVAIAKANMDRYMCDSRQ